MFVFLIFRTGWYGYVRTKIPIWCARNSTVTHCRQNHGTMREKQRNQIVIYHQKAIKVKQTALSLSHSKQDDCKSRNDTLYCTTKQGQSTKPQQNNGSNNKNESATTEPTTLNEMCLVRVKASYNLFNVS